MSYKYNHYI